MYGFPLTIYFLTSLLPLEIPIAHSSDRVFNSILGATAP
jgi:methanethiol S-methyltransferase